MTFGEVATAALLLAGAAFVLLAGLGLWRFDDLYSRIHAATKAITLGVLLVIAGAALRVASGDDLLKLLLAAIFQLMTAPVSGHMLGRAAYSIGIPLSGHTIIDQLQEHESGFSTQGERSPDERTPP